MSAGLKISAFLAFLAVIFGAAYGLGAWVEPVTAETQEEDHQNH